MSTVESRLTAARAHALAGKWRELADEALIASILDDAPVGRVAVVTSFGIESAVLLDMVARINQSVPVIFVNSGRLFPETLAYRDRLIEWLGLTDVRTVAADAAPVARIDPNEKLYLTDTDACCRVRKVEPYVRALVAFDVEITGRKRFQDGARADLEKIELVSSRLKINPLAHWSEADISAAFVKQSFNDQPSLFWQRRPFFSEKALRNLTMRGETSGIKPLLHLPDCLVNRREPPGVNDESSHRAL